MRSKLHSTVFTVLFFFLLWPQLGQSQLSPGSYTPKEDLTKFNWLVLLLKDSHIRGAVFGADEQKKKDEIANLSKGLSPEEQTHLTKFIESIIKSNNQSSFNKFDTRTDRFCKVKPCPPIEPGNEKNWYWAIAPIRDSDLRKKLFDPTTVNAASAELTSEGKYAVAMRDIFSHPDYQTAAKNIADILCDSNVWGPCP